MEYYQAENGSYPTMANMPAALLQYNEGAGNLSAVKDATYIYGADIKSIPALGVGSAKGSNGVGWIYDPTTGHIYPNTGFSADAHGVLYYNY